MPYVPSDWVCVNPACTELDVVKHGEAPADADVVCGACQERCEYRAPP